MGNGCVNGACRYRKYSSYVGYCRSTKLVACGVIHESDASIEDAMYLARGKGRCLVRQRVSKFRPVVGT